MTSIYLETSVVGAYLDNGEPFRRDLTIRWWEHELADYAPYISPLVVRELFEIVTELNEKEGLAVLVVEQNAKLALRSSSRAYVLEVGRVALEGPSAELAENESVRKAYLGY